MVISIIGMLMALLLPAVQAAREAGRRTVCQNNQRQVADALMHYESAHQRFPGFMGEIGKVSGAPIYGSWAAVMFEELGRPDLKDVWKGGLGDTANAQVGLQILTCPSIPGGDEGTTGCSYRLNGGRKGLISDNSGEDTRDCGVFDVDFPCPPGVNPTTWPFSRSGWSLDGMRDGPSTVLMVSENTRSVRGSDNRIGWVVQSTGLTTGTSTTLPSYVATNDIERRLCFVVPQAPTSADISDMRYTTKTGSYDDYLNHNVDDPDRGGSPASYHPGGVVVSFCDGHQSFLSDAVDRIVYMHLITPNSARAQKTGFGYFSSIPVGSVLDESDY
ncbi:MAG: DUF1559 domain-containing protein [Pirellulales bacterium]|nr:DUF1559 domain-containing protein [Pirellulales bacterium]